LRLSKYLDEAIDVLTDLKKDLHRYREFWKQVDKDNPDFDPVSEANWQKKHARCWLHGATDFLETNELERWRVYKIQPSEMHQANSRKCVLAWRQWLQLEDAYYEPFEEFEFEDPLKDEKLGQYIERIGETVKKEGKGARLEWRALKSFLNYLRNFNEEEAAFIEQIFPKKMDVQHGMILRKIAPEVYPLPEEIAGAIVCELAQICCSGRKDVRHAAAESLGLCWLCLTAARLRLPAYLENIIACKGKSLKTDENNHILAVPTLFGDLDVIISQRVAQFLQALFKISTHKNKSTILSKPRRSLTRLLDNVVKKVNWDTRYGHITYVTFLSSPHHFGLQRYQPN
jgi:hypothetical protein